MKDKIYHFLILVFMLVIAGFVLYLMCLQPSMFFAVFVGVVIMNGSYVVGQRTAQGIKLWEFWKSSKKGAGDCE